MLDVVRLRVLVAVARHGSVTAAARALHYSQPSVSHHLARLESETGAQLLQRAGRGVRLTAAGRLLAERATEIIARLDAAEEELAAHVGLRSGRVRLAAFPSALGTFVPSAAARLARDHPGLDLSLTEAEPPEALRMLRAGYIDVAVAFRYGPPLGGVPEEEGVRVTTLLDEPAYLVTRTPHHPTDQGFGDAVRPLPLPGRTDLAAHADAKWIAGCDRCRSHLLDLCAEKGFQPRIAYTTDDYVAVQAMVAAGLGVALLPGLALIAHRRPGLYAAEVPGSTRHVYAATYGEPPDPPPAAALISALVAAIPDLPATV
ncbi:LysR family transcriptional regulator [Thermopolyspora sp. NPDC052614]|uniref:LysR family transcriptional regulator n=1 Tax=Thermopolyspora sp. NPDC052614 TaxID=3155682 RepID=UPI003443FF2B